MGQRLQYKNKSKNNRINHRRYFAFFNLRVRKAFETITQNPESKKIKDG